MSIETPAMKKEKKEVRNLILMLSSAVFVAFIAVVGLVYYFGSSGTYLLKNILVSPQTLERVSFTDFNSKSGKKSPFVLNKIEFVRAQMQGKEWGRFAVSVESYAAFYKLVSSKRSLPQITDDIVAQFELIAPSTLTILVRGREHTGASQNELIFQQVQFIDGGDLFRVKLRSFEEKEIYVEEWIYFRYPGIYKEVVELFAPTLITSSL